MGIFLSDYTRTAFNSDALPLTPPELADFPAYTRFSAGIPDQVGRVLGGPLSSLTPEPGSLVMLSLGIAGLLARRSRFRGR